jgi:hypothetical protein
MFFKIYYKIIIRLDVQVECIILKDCVPERATEQYAGGQPTENNLVQEYIVLIKCNK